MHHLLLPGFAKSLSAVTCKMQKADMKSWQLGQVGVVFQRFVPMKRVGILLKSQCNHLESYGKCEKISSQYICLKCALFLMCPRPVLL